MVNQGWQKHTGVENNITVNHQLVHELISNHRQEDSKIPDRADEQDASEQIMMTFSAPGKDEIQYPTIE
jgi:hypothetical protein